MILLAIALFGQSFAIADHDADSAIRPLEIRGEVAARRKPDAVVVVEHVSLVPASLAQALAVG